MTNSDIACRLDEHTARIESMIFLAGEAYSSRGTDALQEFIDGMDEGFADVFGDRWRAEWDEDVVNSEDFVDLIHEERLHGFLGQFATPVRKYLLGHDACSFSWGHYYTKWFYAESIEDLIEIGIQWSDERRDADRKGSKEDTEKK